MMTNDSAATAAAPPSPLPFFRSIYTHLVPAASCAPLPTASLSRLMQLSHRYLNPVISSAAYFQIMVPPDDRVERERLLLDEILADDCTRLEWSVDDGEGIISRVVLPSNRLAVLLKWEAEHDDDGKTDGKMRWTYWTLELHPSPSSTRYFPNFAGAIEHYTCTHSATQPLPITTIVSASTTNSHRPTSTSSDAAESYVEGTTPGGYGAANDFWSGWKSDEEDSSANVGKAAADKDEEDEDYDSDEDNPTSFCLNSVNASRHGEDDRYDLPQRIPIPASVAKQTSQEDEDASYWDSYGSQNGSSIGDEYQQTSEQRDQQRLSQSSAVLTHGEIHDTVDGGAEGRARSSTLRPTSDRQHSMSDPHLQPLSIMPFDSPSTTSPLGKISFDAALPSPPRSCNSSPDTPTNRSIASSTRLLPRSIPSMLPTPAEHRNADAPLHEAATKMAIRGIWKMYDLRFPADGDEETTRKKQRFAEMLAEVMLER